MYSDRSVLDRVFYQVADELAKDSELVEQFRKLCQDKVQEILPETAVKAAETVCRLAAEGATGYNSEIRKETDERLKAYFQTTEGRKLLDANVKAALVKVVESTMIHEIMQNYVQHEMGSLAREAVRNAIKSETAKARRKTKKVTATA